MSSIPEVLAARFELFRELELVYDLLESVRYDERAAVERSFLEEKIATIEKDLDLGEEEAMAIINHLREDPAALVAAQLRFLNGYTWADISATTGQSVEAIKARVYRAFQRNTQLSVEN